MEFSRNDPNDGFAVRSYTQGTVVVGQVTHTHSLILSPERVLPNWQPKLFAELCRKDFEALLELDPEIIILGTGMKQLFPSPSLYRCVVERGIGIEIMSTAAACRTYNILVSEGRRVVAGLIMI